MMNIHKQTSGLYEKIVWQLTELLKTFFIIHVIVYIVVLKHKIVSKDIFKV